MTRQPDNTCVIFLPWTLSYYNERVARTIGGWPAGIRARFLRLAETMLTHGPNLGMPHTRAMGDGLFEVRASGSEGIGRAFYVTAARRRIVVVHAFIKRTQETPQHELAIARARSKEVRT